MFREPWFWREDTIAAKIVSFLCAPLAALYQAGARLRTRLTTPKKISKPVICVGNITSGGVGKTPFSIALGEALAAQGIKYAFATRGYGGVEKGPVRVNPETHGSVEVGDEALLLARYAPTFVAKNRAAGAQAAAGAGIDVVIMDDGYQNPRVVKDVNILLIERQDPFGNRRTLPAGPLREPVDAAVKRADIVVAVGGPESSQKSHFNLENFESKRVFSSWTEPAAADDIGRVIAFAGIGAPSRFFETLQSAGFVLADQFSFPDHHRYTPAELAWLKKKAANTGAPLITTEKDFVRIPADERADISYLPIRMVIDDHDQLIDLLKSKLQRHPTFRTRNDRDE